MKVVVTGASGHIGTYLIPMLINSGFEVITITRGQAKPYEMSGIQHGIRSHLSP
jgi:uncharacterized protein YbjT (DUF2867 family)